MHCDRQPSRQWRISLTSFTDSANRTSTTTTHHELTTCSIPHHQNTNLPSADAFHKSVLITDQCRVLAYWHWFDASELNGVQHPTQHTTDHFRDNLDWCKTLGLLNQTHTSCNWSKIKKPLREHSFWHTGPAAWNTLPENIHTGSDPAHFYARSASCSKMYYFRLAFNVCQLLLLTL